jgi:Tol biopolymer transport system component
MTTLRLGSLLLLAFVASSGSASARADRSPPFPAPRILYASDWSGTSQLYAVDPSGRRPTAQLTFDRAPACLPGNPCGFAAPVPSPDGARVVFSDYAIQGSAGNVYTAAADGRHRRRVGLLRPFTVQVVWAPDSHRIAYAGKDGIHVVNADGSGPRRVRLNPFDDQPGWSGNGRALAFLNSGRGKEPDTLLVERAGSIRPLVRDRALGYRWAPVGEQLAYETSRGLFVVRSDGSARRRLTATVGGYTWSPDGRLLAYADGQSVKVADLARGSTRELISGVTVELAWSPDGKRIACIDPDGRIQVVPIATGTSRDIGRLGASGPAWSPDSRSLAYGVGTRATTDFGGPVNILVTSLSGATRTVAAASGRFGGAIRGLAWTRPPATVRYRAAAPRTLADVAPDRLVAPWPVERLVADRDRVAYTACGHVFVWTPAARSVVQREATTSLSPACASPTYYTSYKLYSLALAGERVAYGTVFGGNGRLWWLGGTDGARHDAFTLGEGRSTNGLAYYGPIVGELTGAGDLLAFSVWTEVLTDDRVTARTTFEEVQRAGLAGCPCPSLASTPGPLVPFDVDSGRVVAGGDNETWLLDQSGARLLALPVSPRAAQLSGRDLVVFGRGELLHYDAVTGALLHAWPLPDVSVGHECGSPNSSRCFANRAQLVLEDLARGLVAYVLDGQVHELRLADGADAVVATGTLARFVDAGLVYVEGPRLQLVPFDRLPLR